MFHTFDTEVAEQFKDTNIAVLFQNICYWIIHNRTNDRNKKRIDINGKEVERYFTFNSIQAFMKQFPYFSKKQIENYLNKLKDNGFIVKGNFNEKGFDRTSWYCLVDEEYWIGKYLGEKKPSQDNSKSDNNEEENTDPECDENYVESSDDCSTTEDENSHQETANIQSFHFPKRGNAFLQTGKSISPNGEMHFSKTGNPFPQTGKPIPDINPYPKPNIKPNTAASVRDKLRLLDPGMILDEEFYPAAADFLNFYTLGNEYLEWFYTTLKAQPRIHNLHGYFFKVFFRDVYVERYHARIKAQAVKRTDPPERKYQCPVCGEEQIITAGTGKCSTCETPIDPPQEEIGRYLQLYKLDPARKKEYLIARSRAFVTGGNVTENLVEIDRQFGIVS